MVACPYKARNLDAGEFYTEGTPKMKNMRNRLHGNIAGNGPGKKIIPYWHGPEVPLLLPPAEKRNGSYVREHLSARANYFGDLKIRRASFIK